MDDLGMLRDLGGELEHEPPASLARQRRRLADAAAGTVRVRGARRPGRWGLFGAVAAGTAALILVPSVLLSAGGGADPARHADPAAGAGTAMNLLLVGSDARRPGPARADSVVLAHLPADRAKVSVVSLPRDSKVRAPACGHPAGGGPRAAGTARLGAVYAAGGTSCLVKTVQAMTGVRVDRTMVIEFDGFRRMVDALGGVEITMPRALADRNSGLRVHAGHLLLGGAQALAYARARHLPGSDGSDLDRVGRQQRLMAALVGQAKREQLRNPVRFASFLKVAAGAIEVSPKLDLAGFRSLADSLGRTGADDVRIGVVPSRPDRADPLLLAWDQPAASRLFAEFEAGG
ncbi:MULTISPECIES: LCP family protein [Thermomonosporaceae]|uniref:LCP family protein n=1 Tax=Thermomonosporaceae TaxID=2012 RepID=UPI00255AA8CC|nr:MULTISPECIES: LCP family protein [Thermomonosporaceae]MDL4775875.1 LCP family protein [Actinomadura xylanilytica]